MPNRCATSRKPGRARCGRRSGQPRTLHQPRTVLARLQPARPRGSRKSPPSAAGAAAVPVDQRLQPRRILLGAGRRADRPGQGRESPPISPDGRTPAQQLAEIQQRAEALLADQQRIWRELPALLREAGVVLCGAEALSADDVTWLDAWFMERVFPVLTPLAIDPAHPFPFIPNMGLVLALQLVREEDGKGMRGADAAAQPDGALHPAAAPATPGEPIRFMLLEDLVVLFLDRVFPGLPRHRPGHVPADPRHRCGVRGRGRGSGPLVRDRAEAPPPRRRDPSGGERRHAGGTARAGRR